VEYEIPIRETMPPVKPPTGRLRQAVPRDVVDELAQVYDRAQVQRPGRSSRDQRWWMFLTADPKPWRRGRSAQRAVLYEDAGSVDGYAIWRVKDGWSATGPSGDRSTRPWLPPAKPT
jgi:predicted acetyltransferase